MRSSSLESRRQRELSVRQPFAMLCISGGLGTIAKMQVLDKNEKAIPGLYAVGTIVGNMYSGIYTFLEPGSNLGANRLTFGYLVGKEIAWAD